MLEHCYTHTELVVFNQQFGTPLLTEKFSSLVTSLLPQSGSEGYVVLDASAEIRIVIKKGTHSITRLAQSTSAQQLDNVTEETTGDLARLVEAEDEEMDDYQPPTPALIQDEVDDDNETPVVSQQQLSQVFDIGPSYALPPLEEMFYQVAGLFSSKPLVQNV